MNAYQPNNILVTGGAGFIGAHFICLLLKNDQRVNIINLDLLTYAASLQRLLTVADHPRYHFIHGDIGDEALIAQTLREYNIDTIVHFAAESHVDRSIVSPDAFIKTNVLGTFHLLEAARKYWLIEKKLDQQSCRFHHISTDEVYGSLDQDMPAFTESTPYAPNSPYSASKASSDHLVQAYFHTYKLPMTMTNCSNNYGPGQHSEKFIPTIINACLQGQPIPIYGQGKNIRDWLYVVDHCQAIEQVIKLGRLGERYNIGGQDERINVQTVKAICGLMDDLYPQEQPYSRLITFVEDRLGHDFRYAIDIRKIHQELGWRPSTSFEQGLKQTIEWHRQQGLQPDPSSCVLTPTEVG